MGLYQSEIGKMKNRMAQPTFLLLCIAASCVSFSPGVEAASGVEAPLPVEAESVVLESSNGDYDEISTSSHVLTTAEHGQRQIDWIRSQGGFVHEAFEIRHADPRDPDSRVGVFASQDLAAGDLLVVVPRACLLASPSEEICDTVELLAQEMKLGNESNFEPYISYLNSQPYGQLPAMYSKQGKELLNKVLGHGVLPPQEPTEPMYGCYSSPSEFELNAEMLVTQRSWDDILIPVWDMVSHRNGQWTNVAEKYSVHDPEQDVTVHAIRDIHAGEELYMSYNQCPDCGLRATRYGTPEIFRDYGFTEQFPRKYIFPHYEVSYGIDTSDSNEDELIVQWLSQRPDEEAVEFLEGKIEFLKTIQVETLTENKDNVPSSEWNAIVGLHHAFLSGLELAVADATTSNVHKPAAQRRLELVQATIDWVRSTPDGIVHEGLEARFKDPIDPLNSAIGFFATRDIGQGDVLFNIPTECAVYDPEDEFNDEYGELHCGTAMAMAEELSDEEEGTPFMDLIREWYSVKDGNVGGGYGTLPSLFSPSGKVLLQKILGYNGAGPSLPPYDSFDWLEGEWPNTCKGSKDDPIELLAATLVVQRNWGGKVYPLFDLVGHSRSDKLVNTVTVIDSEGMGVRPVRRIRAGEEILTNLVDESTVADWATPQVFRDVGFVESTERTQKWIFGRQEAEFLLLQSADSKELEFQWSGEPISEKGVIDLELELDRLHEEVWSEDLVFRRETIPEHEWVVLVRYAKAVMTAIERLLQVTDVGASCLEHQNEQQCHLSKGRYDALETTYGLEDYNTETCDSIKTLDLSHFKVLEQIQSPYQTITYLEDPFTKNMCFDLDNIYQICTSYRPHYHEYATIYAARFLPEVKRVLWVGGGDSMLLHEIIKFDSLELAIGLELDQKVTRNAFKYFGSQPHWDNDKVQWWYGDAAKSLLMLPKEYFGTFDLVLVDLSETIMSNTVTKGLDIMGALSLLLKPDGIFVKNEMYFEHLSEIFQHTLQVHYYDVPLVCSQVMILGSNSIDFLNVDLTDHDVPTMLDPIGEVDHNFQVVHDYLDNPAAKQQQKCKPDGSDDEEPDESESSPGLVMILEAEGARIDISTANIVKDAIMHALAENNLSVENTRTVDHGSTGHVVTMVLKEGYVVARTWKEHQYIAFDIHLWGSFHKLMALENSLIESVGSSPEASSSFRIVATGMHGIESFAEDFRRRGPKFMEDCDEKPAEIAAQKTQSPIPDVLLKESFNSLVLYDDVLVAVICGPESTKCSSLDVVESSDAIDNVIALRACASIEGGVQYHQDSDVRMIDCERNILNILKKQADVVDVLVLDPEAPFEMAQLLRKIVSRVKNKNAIFSEDLVVLAPMPDPTETWRRLFVDNFRFFYREEPAFFSSLDFVDESGGHMELNVFSSGDPLFITHANEIPSKIEQQTNFSGKVKHVGGVAFTMQEDMDWTQSFVPQDFEQDAPYKQWKSQQPEGLQTIFQFKSSAELARSQIEELLSAALKKLSIDTVAEEFADHGDGSLFIASWSEGNVVVLWDGKDNVGLNLFTYEERVVFANNFSAAFTQTGLLESALRDEMPRGHGRVVNLRKDLEPRRDPHFVYGMAN
eukprot:CAMPEP_0172455196 /NCGR_PEP_ID=MMETSP1065-20121228/11940_1 /TAXON_ID=265537 /ORGANISM="Amphiprora paludosa, Strain CCMP125" /LENGTH=1595 /DNA_ID=CAMNT_0013207655 /DNA_START=24 /DNA_END=4811 /DNA_ORIENTATION=+